MKEFIDKLITSLEEENEWAKTHGTDDSFRKGRISGLNTAKRIVNQLAEEYKGGWIPCSERLPKEQDEYLVTWIPEYFPKKRFCEIVEYSPEDGWIGKIPQAPFGKYTIIAWRPLPQPYREGE